MGAAAYQSGNVEVRGFAPRQAEALAHTFEGLTAKEAARAMGVSPRTVEMYLTLAMVRLSARNKRHLIYRAITTGSLVVRSLCLALAFGLVLIVASTPSPTHQPDDMARISRTLRVRRNREDFLSATSMEDLV